MINNYLKTIGLGQFDGTQYRLDTIVKKAFEKVPHPLTNQEVEKLYVFDVPKLGPGGACSITHEKEDKPYNLTEIFGRQYDVERLKGDPLTTLLWRLNTAVQNLHEELGADWTGIYKKVEKKNGEVVLVKMAYRGVFSRAEFPLNEEFAKMSNNSTVGLTKKAILIGDVNTYSGAYYECD